MKFMILLSLLMNIALAQTAESDIPKTHVIYSGWRGSLHVHTYYDKSPLKNFLSEYERSQEVMQMIKASRDPELLEILKEIQSQSGKHIYFEIAVSDINSINTHYFLETTVRSVHPNGELLGTLCTLSENRAMNDKSLLIPDTRSLVVAATRCLDSIKASKSRAQELRKQEELIQQRIVDAMKDVGCP